jgi:hypothetical protein
MKINICIIYNNEEVLILSLHVSTSHGLPLVHDMCFPEGGGSFILMGIVGYNILRYD